MCKLKRYKTSNTHIDKCMNVFITNLEIALKHNFKVVACCCGHKKYKPTVIIRRVRYNGSLEHYDLISGITIPRTRNFYKRDKQGYYYIKEIDGGNK